MNEQKTQINVGLIGLGTVGTGVAKVLLGNAENLAKRAGTPIVLKAAADLDITRDRGVDLSGVALTTDARAMIADPQLDVIVEVMGGVQPAREFITMALRHRKHVVTSNKEVIAKHGPEFVDLALENGVNLYFEAAVGGGIPIIHTLKNCLAANNIEKVFGILNGTTNFILTKMYKDGADFGAVLQEAQQLGYAEANPTADVDGYDAAYKLSILASLAFNSHFRYEDIHFEGIRNISARDIEVARQHGMVIKLVGIGIDRKDGSVELRVHPVLIDEWHPLAGVNGSFNAVFVKGNYVGETMFYGPGAGELPTASAVVGDILDIAMHEGLQVSHPSISTHFRDLAIMPFGNIETEYYLRLTVKDEAGVLAAITRIFADCSVSIKLIEQKESHAAQTEIVVITHTVREASMQAAVEKLRTQPCVVAVNALIRAGL